MKRLSLAIILACCTLAVAAQEDGFRVNYQGAKPTIKDFALAYITSLISEAEHQVSSQGTATRIKQYTHYRPKERFPRL